MSVAYRLPNWLAHPSTKEMGGALFDQSRFMSPDSYWRKPITDKTPYQHPTIAAANSANWVKSLCWQQGFDIATGKPSVYDLNPVTGAQLLPLRARVLGRAWMSQANPLYVVPAGYPRREFRGTDRLLGTVGGSALDRLMRQGIPAPLDAGITSDNNTDRWLNIYQPSTDTIWELFSVSRSDPNGPIDRANWGGVMIGVSAHFGTYSNRYDIRDIQVESERWSGNACSISNVAGMVSPEELMEAAAKGTDLGHAIPMSLGHAQGSPIQYIYPARRGDGIEYNRPDYIPEGAIITFPDNADFSRVPKEFMPIALSAQKYGIVTRDKTGYGCTLQLRHYSIADPTHTPTWGDALPLYKTTSIASHTYQMSLPWHQAIIVQPKPL